MTPEELEELTQGLEGGQVERPRWDSNPRITDLQSVPLVHLGTRPKSWWGRSIHREAEAEYIIAAPTARTRNG